jgi:hypothetical protein
VNHGKKIGTLLVRLDRVVEKVRWGGYSNRRAEFGVDLRFDLHTGLFHASHDGIWYAAKTKEDLEAQLKKAVERTIDLVWERYLVVSYDATARLVDAVLNAPNSNAGTIYSIERDRTDLPTKKIGNARRAITSIELTWNVVEYTRPWPRPEDGKLVRSKRDLRSSQGKEYVDDPIEQDSDALPTGAVLWSKEREDLLHEILAAIGKLDSRMTELFRGGADDLAKKLDAAMLDPGRLLAAPAESQPKKKRRRS